MAMKVEIIHKETIKPSSPTPPDLKTVKLSLLDQFTPVSYIPLILFYPACAERSQMLKTSLSETLTLWYPLAGRLKDNAYVECEDQGAEYLEARINCPLSEFLNKPDVEVLKQLLPAAVETPEAATGNLLRVQTTFFDCGGLAIGVCISHKMADAATVMTFIRSWAATANGSSELVRPLFMGASTFPPIDMSIPMVPVKLMQRKCITKRFVFSGSKIAALRTKVASTSVPKPSRVEAVSGLIWKGVMTAVRSNSGCFRPSVWAFSVNLRKRLVPALAENYSGNCVVGFIGPKIMEDKELELQGLVGRISKEMDKFGENYAKKLQVKGALLAIREFSKEFGEIATSDNIDFYICSSWCKYGIYDTDFGWGRPIWVSKTSRKVRNVAILMDTSDGDGIEAWLTLSEEDMALLESNQELLEFAALNPSVPLS
ncbi:hypothetical protein P3X46_011580 [Hevea brasiliensis]|uniref:BAHD acyltransferase n=2 Tax=Hevea brasiliensis TaxID=3981 RepID=A0ABQ9MB85_HEVBR|nr:hypothetical protein P3X46_011580 [Hevea brasiliensis]